MDYFISSSPTIKMANKKIKRNIILEKITFIKEFSIIKETNFIPIWN